MHHHYYFKTELNFAESARVQVKDVEDNGSGNGRDERIEKSWSLHSLLCYKLHRNKEGNQKVRCVLSGASLAHFLLYFWNNFILQKHLG